jgi:hypothetical protein
MSVRRLIAVTRAGSRLVLGLALSVVLVSCESLPPSSREATPSASGVVISGSPIATATPTVPRDYLLFVDSRRGELVLADTAGNESSHIAGAGMTHWLRLAIDPTNRRVAYWREAGATYELVIWESGSPTVTVLATESELMPWATPVWTSDSESIVTTVATPPSAAPPGAPPARGRLDIRSASGGAARTLTTFAGEYPIVALFADRDTVAGLRSGRTNMTYVVLDAKTGGVRKQTDAATFRFSGSAVHGRVTWGLTGEFESTKPGTLRVWPVEDYGREAARVEVAGAGIPMAWPGRTEIAFSTSTPGRDEIRALDYASGSSRIAGVVGLGGSPLGFSSDGSMLLLYQATVSPYRLARIAADGTLGPATPYRVGGRPDDPTFEFLGWLRF